MPLKFVQCSIDTDWPGQLERTQAIVVRWSVVPVLVALVGYRVVCESTGPWLSHRRCVLLIAIPWLSEASISHAHTTLLRKHTG